MVFLRSLRSYLPQAVWTQSPGPMLRRKQWLPPSPHCTARCGSVLHCCCSQNPHPTPQICPPHPLLLSSCKEHKRPVRLLLHRKGSSGLPCWPCAVWKKGNKYHLAWVRHPGSSTQLQGIYFGCHKVWFKEFVFLLNEDHADCLDTWNPVVLRLQLLVETRLSEVEINKPEPYSQS